MKRVFALAGNPWVRAGFLVAALALAVWAVARDWTSVSDALAGIPVHLTIAALVASFAYIAASMQSWRVILADLGSPLGLRHTAEVFLVSQVGKYVPGGVWNIVAGAELARDRGVSRARAASALAITMLVSVLTGITIAGLVAALAPHHLPAWVRIAGVLAVPAAAGLAPRMLSRLLGLALRVARRPDAVSEFTARGIAAASAWSVAAWIVAGLQVWALAVGLGTPTGIGTAIVTIGAFAAAWVAGFAVLFLPAGLGARELVLAPAFAAYLDRPGVIALVLGSRVLFTVADVAAALVPFAWRRRRG